MKAKCEQQNQTKTKHAHTRKKSKKKSKNLYYLISEKEHLPTLRAMAKHTVEKHDRRWYK